MTTPAAIHTADERMQTILKPHVVGATVQDPANRPAGEDTAAAFTSAGALVPPYDPETLCLGVEHSNSLRQNVDAYATKSTATATASRGAFVRRGPAQGAARGGRELRS